MSTRRTTRSSRRIPSEKKDVKKISAPVAPVIVHYENTVDDAPSAGQYEFQGIPYDTYQEMVNAKRERNQRKLQESGLLDAVVAQQRQRRPMQKKPPQGIVATKRPNAAPMPRRASKRLKGESSDGTFVQDERNGRFEVGGNVGEGTEETTIQQFYRGRVNDGAPLSIEDAVNECEDKWIQDTSVEIAVEFVKELNTEQLSSTKNSPWTPHTAAAIHSSTSPTTIDDFPTHDRDLHKMIQALSVNDEGNVAKVCPDRIYSMAVHPSLDSTIVCAGDKRGYVGLWKRTENNDDTHCLFRPHGGAVSCLQWNPSGRRLWSTSYDGSVRSLDVETQEFEQVFATYDDSPEYQSKLGFDMDTGSKFWIQYGCVDPRNEDCLFLSTSIGTAMHVDLRSRQRITFDRELSEKKINTLSIHPNGHTMVSAGLDCTVAVWDIRKMGTKKIRPISSYDCGRSINSAFLSATGESLVCTTMANTLEIFSSVTTNNSFQPSEVIAHDNKTGRWLTTFQAVYHPNIENLFGVGSMAKPRRFDLFECAEDKHRCILRGVSGDALTATVSRIAFHPRSDRIIVAGGNSSGRVTIAQ